MSHKNGQHFEGAIAILRRIEALPLVRRRGESENHREPVWRDNTERAWREKGVYDECGGLLLLASKAAVTVTRWQLQVAYELALMAGNSLWAKRQLSFDEVFGTKSHYQLIEVLEAVVKENMDIPTLPFSTQPLLPVWEEYGFNQLVLVEEIRRRYYRILAKVMDSDKRSLHLQIEDYGGARLIVVNTTDTGLSQTIYNGQSYEKQHVYAIRQILTHLINKGLLRDGVFEERLAEMMSRARENTFYPEQ